MTDKQTLDIYADQAAKYEDLIREEALNDPLLMAFIDALPKGARVLDIGCGPGLSAGVMAQAGLQVTAMDPVPEMLARAATRPGVKTVQGSFDDLPQDPSFDAIWANFSLLHTPRADIPRHLAACRNALAPGGLLHVALKTGTGARRDKIGRLYTYLTDAELSGLLQDAGFTITARTTGNGAGLSGEDAPWIALRAHA